ncbi:MAG: hypothetical protein ACLSD5_02560 [Eggerthella lenta]
MTWAVWADPLFFYQPIRPNAVRREGIKMHRRSALPAVERLRQAIEDGVPMSTGYGAGFLCHLALDSACHGYVDDRRRRPHLPWPLRGSMTGC